jgi:hypothetical protein
MARPFKQGLDYFPLDVTFDNEIELFEAECGLSGFAILIKLWQKIYSEGYFLKWNSDNEMLFAKRINSSVNDIREVINVCIRRNILDKRMYELHSILTSMAIQKRYFMACKGSKRKNVSAVKNYLLVDGDYLKLIDQITELKELTPEETRLTPELSTQRKGNRKEIESKENRNLFNGHFDEFWAAYPRKVAKVAAQKAWSKVKVEESTFDDIMKGLDWHKRTEWEGKETGWIPHASTWLNDKRWVGIEDAAIQEQPTAADYKEELRRIREKAGIIDDDN